MPADPVIAAAIARANADCAAGIANLVGDAAAAPEWSAGARFNGSRYVDPKRAKAAGMLAFLQGRQ